MHSVGPVNAALRRVPAWSLYVASAGWAAWLFYLGLTGGLGVEPINALERAYGDVAIKLLIAGLAVTPLRRFTGVNLMRFRRAIGLSAFFFVVAHFAVFALLDVQSWDRVWQEIVKRPYVTVGMVSFVALIPLAITSNNPSLRRLGPVVWRRLHRLTYPAAALAAVHYLWIAKGLEIAPIVHAILILGLLALRLPVARRTVPA